MSEESKVDINEDTEGYLEENEDTDVEIEVKSKVRSVAAILKSGNL